MMHAVYDWAFGVYRLVFGNSFVPMLGVYSWPSRKALRHSLQAVNLDLKGDKVITIGANPFA